MSASKSKQQRNLVNERDLLKQCKHPFISFLYKTFRDEECVFLLTELVPSGEFFTLLHKRATSPYMLLSQIKFYSVCILSALEYLHELSIAFRDLKPENILVDFVGYLKLVDFGSSKKCVTTTEGSMATRNVRTKTFVGTVEYMAPEVVLRKKHTESVDIWSFGILVYEMIFKKTPFQSSKGDKYVLKNIIENTLTLRETKLRVTDLEGPLLSPDFDDESKSFLEFILERNYKERPKAKDIFHHSWFAEVDISRVKARHVKAPWMPDIKGLTDFKYFPEPKQVVGAYKARTWFKSKKNKKEDWDITFSDPVLL